jgi:hypothetical protein
VTLHLDLGLAITFNTRTQQKTQHHFILVLVERSISVSTVSGNLYNNKNNHEQQQQQQQNIDIKTLCLFISITSVH